MRILTLSMTLALTMPSVAGDGKDPEQARLDAECERAREAKLAPLRARLVEECVATGQRPDREACERFYADYGNRSGNRAPLFYDLPECVKAFEYQRRERSPD